MAQAISRPHPRFSSLAEWLEWQERLHVKEIDLGLGRCRRVASRLGIRAPHYTVISVAGTNGKGSSVEMLGGILAAAGYRTALYTSPHILRYNERVRIDGAAIDDAALCEAFERIDAVRGQTSLTYFEFGTLAALDIFQRSEIDVAVLEVGLGGRLDAVNMLDADAALVTSIDIDHTDWLGDTRESIGREKAGICRPGRPLIISDPAPPDSVLEVAAGVAARAVRLERDFDYAIEAGSWSWRTAGAEYSGLPRPALPGDFQIQNAAGVLAVLHALADRLPVDRCAIDAGLAATRLAGRLQVIDGPVSYLLDVAHNAEAARRLAAWMIEHPAEGAEHLVVGMLRDKDAKTVFEPFRACAGRWYFGGIDSPRGAEARALEAALPAGSGPAQCFASVAAALAAARQAAVAGDRITVTGSFLTVADAVRTLQR